MDMIKFLLGIAVVGFTSFCGRLLAKKYRQRNNFFKQFKEFNERFLNEITYSRRPLMEFVKAYSYEGEFEELLQEFYVYLKENCSTPYFLQDNPRYVFLKSEDKKFIQDYFLMLGKGDSLSQKGYFSSVKDGLLKLYAEAQSDAKRYSDLYVKIGFLCGLLLLILMV
jgi:stage III sporulation protein AB